MCGFAGIFDPYKIFNSEDLIKYSINMASELIHRGPDDDGTWFNEFIAISHRRLSIQDLTKAGSQPMRSKCGRYIIAFNGEIYNHLEFREEIKKINNFTFRSFSDTESLIEYIALFGIEKTLKKINGMFAFALWDNKLKSLHLARDSFGEKPLYYGWLDESLVFASELKAIRKNPNFKNKINKKAIAEYLNKGYVPSPLSIYENIYKIEPGSYISLDCNFPKFPPKDPISLDTSYGNIIVKKFFDINNLISSSNRSNNQRKYTQELEEIIINSLELQSKADVPIGVLLSGGIDSSIIVSLLKKTSIKKINTFTLGFNQNEFNESKKAHQISKIIGTNHQECFIKDSDILNLIPRLPYIYDEPFADSSQIPSWVICSISSQKYKVLLSGDGGDELFGGYPRYDYALKQSKLLNFFDYRIRRKIGNYGQNILQKDFFNSLMYSSINSSKNKKLAYFLNKLNKLLYRLHNVKNIYDLDKDMKRIWEVEEQFLYKHNTNSFSGKEMKQLRKDLMIFDLKEYLTDDLICKMERSSMDNSIELRMPFLDKKLVEFSLSLPTDILNKENKSKYLLKKILEKYLPYELINSPKKGFTFPLSEMLRTNLFEWANDLINSYDLEEETFITKDIIKKIWIQHNSGNYDWSQKIWTILMYISWRKINI